MKRWKLCLGMPLYLRRTRLAWFQKFSMPLMCLFLSGELTRVVYTLVLELTHIQRVVAMQTIRVDDRIGYPFLTNDRLRLSMGIV